MTFDAGEAEKGQNYPPANPLRPLNLPTNGFPAGTLISVGPLILPFRPRRCGRFLFLIFLFFVFFLFVIDKHRKAKEVEDDERHPQRDD